MGEWFFKLYWQIERRVLRREAPDMPCSLSDLDRLYRYSDIDVDDGGWFAFNAIRVCSARIDAPTRNYLIEVLDAEIRGLERPHPLGSLFTAMIALLGMLATIYSVCITLLTTMASTLISCNEVESSTAKDVFLSISSFPQTVIFWLVVGFIIVGVTFSFYGMVLKDRAKRYRLIASALRCPRRN